MHGPLDKAEALAGRPREFLAASTASPDRAGRGTERSAALVAARRPGSPRRLVWGKSRVFHARLFDLRRLDAMALGDSDQQSWPGSRDEVPIVVAMGQIAGSQPPIGGLIASAVAVGSRQ